MPRIALFLLLSAFFFLLPSAAAQQRPIQDNSFLVEEAYNQEESVVQHITTFQRSWTMGTWMATFTQEWPFNPAPRHQLSYTLSGVHDPVTGSGPGDTLLNYRYQLVGSGDTRVAFAPRVSGILPTGSYRDGRGFGGAGVQTNLPLSVVVSKHLVTHWNAGATIVPAARNAAGDRAATYGYNFGQSVIWLAKPRFNFMLESVFAANQMTIGPGRTRWTRTALISPGARWAFNFASGLQIVPGIAFPMGVGPSAGEKSIFGYISFEHPFGKRHKKQ